MRPSPHLTSPRLASPPRPLPPSSHHYARPRSRSCTVSSSPTAVQYHPLRCLWRHTLCTNHTASVPCNLPPRLCRFDRRHFVLVRCHLSTQSTALGPVLLFVAGRGAHRTGLAAMISHGRQGHHVTASQQSARSHTAYAAHTNQCVCFPGRISRRATCYLLVATCHLPPATCYLLPATYLPPITVNKVSTSFRLGTRVAHGAPVVKSCRAAQELHTSGMWRLILLGRPTCTYHHPLGLNPLNNTGPGLGRAASAAAAAAAALVLRDPTGPDAAHLATSHPVGPRQVQPARARRPNRLERRRAKPTLAPLLATRRARLGRCQRSVRGR